MLREWDLAQLSQDSICNLRQQWLVSLSLQNPTPAGLHLSLPLPPSLSLSAFLYPVVSSHACLIFVTGISSPLGAWVKIQSKWEWEMIHTKKTCKEGHTNHCRPIIRSMVKQPGRTLLLIIVGDILLHHCSCPKSHTVFFQMRS